jgi:PhoPQ-activated pathogenicity-related protein
MAPTQNPQENTMSKKTAAVAKTAVAVAAKPAKMLYTCKTVDGAVIEVTHAFRRRYRVAVNGKPAGYITAGTVMNAIGRVETATDVKALREMLHAE